MTTPFRAGLGALTAALVLAAPAVAAEPEQGTLDPFDSPMVEWTGEATGTAVQFAHFFYGAQLVDDCVAPLCDSFTLTVTEKDQKVEIGAEDSTGYTEMQIKDAAGNEIFWSEGQESGPTVFKKTKMAAGTYTVEVLTDDLLPGIDSGEYFAYAKMNDGIAKERPAAE